MDHKSFVLSLVSTLSRSLIIPQSLLEAGEAQDPIPPAVLAKSLHLINTSYASKLEHKFSEYAIGAAVNQIEASLEQERARKRRKTERVQNLGDCNELER
jgi:hypothetical protein